MPRGGKREGSGRKSVFGDVALVPVSFKMPAEVAELIRVGAAEMGISQVEYVVKACALMTSDYYNSPEFRAKLEAKNQMGPEPPVG